MSAWRAHLHESAVSVSASRIVGLRANTRTARTSSVSSFSIRESDRWVESQYLIRQLPAPGRFSIRESDRWVERTSSSAVTRRGWCFSIRESDRWVERVEARFYVRKCADVSVSASRIVGLRGVLAPWTESAVLRFQYPRVGSLG